MRNQTTPRHSDNFTPGTKEWRTERFAELRAHYPDMEHDQIWEAIHDDEVSELEAVEGRRILAEMDA